MTLHSTDEECVTYGNGYLFNILLREVLQCIVAATCDIQIMRRFVRTMYETGVSSQKDNRCHAELVTVRRVSSR